MKGRIQPIKAKPFLLSFALLRRTSLAFVAHLHGCGMPLPVHEVQERRILEVVPHACRMGAVLCARGSQFSLDFLECCNLGAKIACLLRHDMLPPLGDPGVEVVVQFGLFMEQLLGFRR